MLASLSWAGVGFPTAREARPSPGRASGHVFPLRSLSVCVDLGHLGYLGYLLFKIRALRQESPIAVQLQFGAWSPQNGASTPMKIAVNCACLQLIALNSLLYT